MKWEETIRSQHDVNEKFECSRADGNGGQSVLTRMNQYLSINKEGKQRKSPFNSVEKKLDWYDQVREMGIENYYNNQIATESQIEARLESGRYLRDTRLRDFMQHLR